MKLLLPEEEKLYDELNRLRNAIFNSSCYYTNDTLVSIASKHPTSKDELLQIDSSEEKYNTFGESFLAIVKSPQHDSKKLSDTEISTVAHIRRLEILLYRIVQDTLQKEFKTEWWFEGIPEPIRRKAADLHETSRGIVPKEYGLMFVDLKEIVSKQWRLFSFLAGV